MNEDLKIIKKKYGEAMMHFCRESFSTILEEEGKLSQFLLDHFYPSHNLYVDLKISQKINEFKNYIYNGFKKEKKKHNAFKTPEELFNEAGYDFFECHTEKEIQTFKKYYANGEELCTFNGGRLKSCYVFFAVKKNVEEIKREDFKNPERQDEYGTSVISIQFTKDENHTLSIKNRYNHTVVNPDATFSNNLDNIILGLTVSFEQYYGIVQKHKSDSFEIPNYVLASDGIYYKYKQEVNNIYYCLNNIIIDNFKVRHYEKEKYIIMDYFIVDLQNKKIELYDKELSDAFLDGLQDIKDIKIEKNETGRIIYITLIKDKVIEIGIDEENSIISYKNDYLDYIGDYFLFFNKKLTELSLSKVEKVGNCFLSKNHLLTKISLPSVIEIGTSFLYLNEKIESVNLPNVESIGTSFLCSNKQLIRISLPNVQEIKTGFIPRNQKIQKVNLPKVKSIGDYFLRDNLSLKELILPNVVNIGDGFLYDNNYLNYLELPNLEKIKSGFLNNNEILKSLNLPKVKFIGNYFMYCNIYLENLNMPNLVEICQDFLVNNKNLKVLNLPNAITIGEFFLNKNNLLESMYAPNLVELGEKSLVKNTTLKNYDFSSLKKAHKCFISHPTLKFKLNTLILKNQINDIRNKLKSNR